MGKEDYSAYVEEEGTGKYRPVRLVSICRNNLGKLYKVTICKCYRNGNVNNTSIDLSSTNNFFSFFCVRKILQKKEDVADYVDFNFNIISAALWSF